MTITESSPAAGAVPPTDDGARRRRRRPRIVTIGAVLGVVIVGWAYLAGL